MAMPMPPLSVTGGAAGPSSAGEYGDAQGFGQTVGDYYGDGSRVRKDNGIDWKMLAVIGVVALVALKVWKQ